MSNHIEVLKVSDRGNGRKHIAVPVRSGFEINDYVLVKKINKDELRDLFENKTNIKK